MTDRSRRSNGIVTEKADLNTNREVFESNYDKIFGSKKPLMPIEINYIYRHVGSELEYKVVGFVTDKDSETDKVLYADASGTHYTRCRERFRQKFELIYAYDKEKQC